MYICYLDESGTPEISGNTSHYILAGLCIPIWHWKTCDIEVRKVCEKYNLVDKEIHTAWILRSYIEQTKIPKFDSMSYHERRENVQAYRNAELIRLQKLHGRKAYKQAKKNYSQTQSYIHLTLKERRAFICDLAKCVSGWGFARLFAECIDKVKFGLMHSPRTVAEQALEELVSHFEQYLTMKSRIDGAEYQYGLLIHDNNPTVAKKHTAMMKNFHKSGTLSISVKHIVETPLFVDSELTSMVQISDLCSYALRRYLENDENTLFDMIFVRADRVEEKPGKKAGVIGVRHFTPPGCKCKICLAYKSLVTR
jgi:hypothetical protein